MVPPGGLIDYPGVLPGLQGEAMSTGVVWTTAVYLVAADRVVLKRPDVSFFGRMIQLLHRSVNCLDGLPTNPLLTGPRCIIYRTYSEYLGDSFGMKVKNW